MGAEVDGDHTLPPSEDVPPELLPDPLPELDPLDPPELEPDELPELEPEELPEPEPDDPPELDPASDCVVPPSGLVPFELPLLPLPHAKAEVRAATVSASTHAFAVVMADSFRTTRLARGPRRHDGRHRPMLVKRDFNAPTTMGQVVVSGETTSKCPASGASTTCTAMSPTARARTTYERP
jgi:hypothetical protein